MRIVVDRTTLLYDWKSTDRDQGVELPVAEDGLVLFNDSAWPIRHCWNNEGNQTLQEQLGMKWFPLDEFLSWPSTSLGSWDLTQRLFVTDSCSHSFLQAWPCCINYFGGIHVNTVPSVGLFNWLGSLFRLRTWRGSTTARRPRTEVATGLDSDSGICLIKFCHLRSHHILANRLRETNLSFKISGHRNQTEDRSTACHRSDQLGW